MLFEFQAFSCFTAATVPRTATSASETLKTRMSYHGMMSRCVWPPIWLQPMSTAISTKKNSQT